MVPLATGGMIVASTTLAYALSTVLALIGYLGPPGTRSAALWLAVAVFFTGAALLLVARVQSSGSDSVTVRVTSGTLIIFLTLAAFWFMPTSQSMPYWIKEMRWTVELLFLLASGIMAAAHVFAKEKALGCIASAWRLALGASAALLAVDGLLMRVSSGAEGWELASLIEPAVIAGVLVAVSWTLSARPKSGSM